MRVIVSAVSRQPMVRIRATTVAVIHTYIYDVWHRVCSQPRGAVGRRTQSRTWCKRKTRTEMPWYGAGEQMVI